MYIFAKRINLVAGSEGIRLMIENGNPDDISTLDLGNGFDHAFSMLVGECDFFLQIAKIALNPDVRQLHVKLKNFSWK